jgi:hypothetical protein
MRFRREGFHNFLYYSRKLANAATIDKIIVWEQGRGVINNLGALRTKPLAEWDGLYNTTTKEVYQWDGSTLSPVIHQYDRDNDLFKYMTRVRHKTWVREYKARESAAPVSQS